MAPALTSSPATEAKTFFPPQGGPDLAEDVERLEDSGVRPRHADMMVRYSNEHLTLVRSSAHHRLGSSGLFVATDAPPSPGTLLSFAMDLPGHGSVSGIVCVKTARSPELATPTRPAGMALKFVHLDDPRNAAVLLAGLLEAGADPAPASLPAPTLREPALARALAVPRPVPVPVVEVPPAPVVEAAPASIVEVERAVETAPVLDRAPLALGGDEEAPSHRFFSTVPPPPTRPLSIEEELEIVDWEADRRASASFVARQKRLRALVAGVLGGVALLGVAAALLERL